MARPIDVYVGKYAIALLHEIWPGLDSGDDVLRLGVRVDRAGKIICDFQTASADGADMVKATASNKHVMES